MDDETVSGIGDDFSILGQKIKGSINFVETFPKPVNVSSVRMICREFTSVCPITGQPDYSIVTVDYIPTTKCIESKSLKLYLQKYRNEGVFCEALAAELARELQFYTDAKYVRVIVQQAPRGGIEIISTAEVGDSDE